MSRVKESLIKGSEWRRSLLTQRVFSNINQVVLQLITHSPNFGCKIYVKRAENCFLTMLDFFRTIFWRRSSLWLKLNTKISQIEMFLFFSSNHQNTLVFLEQKSPPPFVSLVTWLVKFTPKLDFKNHLIKLSSFGS